MGKTSPKRIAMVTTIPESNIGGAQMFIARLGEEIMKRGGEVTLFVNNEKIDTYRGMRVVYFQGLANEYVASLTAIMMLAFWLWLHRRRFDCIHVYAVTRIAAGAVLGGWLTGKPVVISSGGTDVSGVNAVANFDERISKRRWLNRIVWFLISRTDLYAAKSQENADRLLSRNIPPERVVIVPNGVPDYPQVRLRANPLGMMKVVNVARLKPQKSQNVLLDAAALFDQMHITLVGDGPERQSLFDQAAALGISDRVTFTGNVASPPETELPLADVFALSSSTEGMPNALLEAMVCGLPCIVTNVGGVGQVITHEENGLLIPPDDPQALADAARRLYNDEAFRRRLGENARRTIQDNLTMSKIADRFFDIYARAYDIRHGERSTFHKPSESQVTDD